jgi:hypothetical protein
MRNRIRAILLSGGTALAIGLTAAPSFATTTTWTISPGGSIAGTAGTTKLSQPKTGFAIVCTSSGIAGTLKKGSGLSGTKIGTITKPTFGGCSVKGSSVLSLGVRVPWAINFKSLAKGVVHGTFTGVGFSFSANSCSATISGTSAAGAGGTVGFAWTLSTSELKLVPAGSNLHFYDVSGCIGLLSDGDTATYTATFKMSPSQQITDP